MTIFKTFWQIIFKYKFIVITYALIMLLFGTVNVLSSKPQTEFSAQKPNLYIINQDQNSSLSQNFINYLAQHTNLQHFDYSPAAVRDALFYRRVDFVLTIPSNFQADLLAGKTPTINTQSTQDYRANLAEVIIAKYLKIQNLHQAYFKDSTKLTAAINQSLTETPAVKLQSELDTTKLSRVASYFNFANYSILGGIISIICLVLASFRKPSVEKRTIIGGTNYRLFNRQLLASSACYAFLVWLIFLTIAIILLGDHLFTLRGLLYLVNSLLFTFCALTLALLIASITTNKSAIEGIVNIIGLGSSFLAGAFVPAKFLPDSVLFFSRISPSFWYVNTNDTLSTLESFNLSHLAPIFFNFLIILLFTIIFIFLKNLVTKHKRKIA